jgi:hypothetical protein
VVSGCGQVTNAEKFLFSEDTVWMANVKNEWVVQVQSNLWIAHTFTEERAALFTGMCLLEGHIWGTCKFGPKWHVATVKPVKQGHPRDEPEVSLITGVLISGCNLHWKQQFGTSWGVLIWQDVLISQGCYSQVSLYSQVWCYLEVCYFQVSLYSQICH